MERERQLLGPLATAASDSRSQPPCEAVVCEGRGMQGGEKEPLELPQQELEPVIRGLLASLEMAGS